MSTSAQTSSSLTDDAENLVRLRNNIKLPSNPQIARAQGEDLGSGLKHNGYLDASNSALSSGTSTPLPVDAPPSAQSISSARKQLRAQQKRRLFPTIEYTARVSHFDPDSDYRDFHGFFALFWIGLAIMVVTTMARNLEDTGWPIRGRVWSLFTPDIRALFISDGLMVASTAVSLPLHSIFRNSRGWLQWRKGGRWVQSIYQAAWLLLWVDLPFRLHWTWTAQVFFTLHTLTLLMKMHSWAFYNGHLSETQRHLSSLDHPETKPDSIAAVHYPSSGTDVDAVKEKEMDIKDTEIDNHTGASDDDDDDDAEAIAQLREDLAMELTSPLGRVTYPQNLTAGNYIDYILCPTLCYELEYPRTPGTRWSELLWKSLAVFGCIFLLTVTSEEFITPVLDESAIRLARTRKLTERGLILAETINMLLFPFMVSFLLTFLVIFEYVLGAFAEITCFADRHFYADWWNSTDWLEFSREWNIPVHHFFRRHVYSASRPHVGRRTATIITFFISAVGHELVMGCISKKVRGYGFLAQMMQLPIVMIQRTRWVRGRKTFNICALYVLL
ncbi:MAG: hypothetical protein M1819_003843 [Sarea resinae]|nr:MAG: hypothetical protein M1819_003843 [Sarea resinae]